MIIKENNNNDLLLALAAIGTGLVAASLAFAGATALSGLVHLGAFCLAGASIMARKI